MNDREAIREELDERSRDARALLESDFDPVAADGSRPTRAISAAGFPAGHEDRANRNAASSGASRNGCRSPADPDAGAFRRLRAQARSSSSARQSTAA